VIAALYRRIRARKARRQARWMTGYIRDRHGDGHAIARQQAFTAWDKYRP